MGPYNDYFGRQIAAGTKTKIVFTSDDATYPFITENKTMWDVFEPGLKEQLSELDAETPVSQRVKSILLTMLPSGHSSVEAAAGKLAMSPRTLQRHLAKESLNFQTILNGTRKELAQHYLNNPAISTGEISYLLGYQDSNSFLRAFKDWTGMTPGEYRQPHHRGGSFH
jgi:AraC-like DNA-binding protein